MDLLEVRRELRIGLARVLHQLDESPHIRSAARRCRSQASDFLTASHDDERLMLVVHSVQQVRKAARCLRCRDALTNMAMII